MSYKPLVPEQESPPANIQILILTHPYMKPGMLFFTLVPWRSKPLMYQLPHPPWRSTSLIYQLFRQALEEYIFQAHADTQYRIMKAPLARSYTPHVAL